MSLILLNRSPEPDELDWPITGLIQLDIVNTLLADAPDPTSVRVFVDGVLALSGSAFQTGWDGPGSSIVSVAADMLRITLDSTGQFASLETVQVHVTVNAAASTTFLDQTYQFTAEDLSVPELIAVRALSLTTIEATFSEEVNAAALVPGNYALTRQIAPSVDATIVSVVQTAPTVYVLTTSTELTHLVSYMLTVTVVEDLSGNVIAPPLNALTFNSFMPAIPANRDFDLFRMLPQMNRDQDTTDDLKKITACLQELTEQMLFSIDAWTQILDVDVAPEPFVDAMLADLGNPFSFPLTLVDKRRLARVLVAIYKQKGLGKGIKNAVRFFLGFEVTITPFVEDGMSLGDSLLGVDWILGTGNARASRTFNLNVTIMLTADQQSRLLKIATYMKPVNTHIGLLIQPTVPETFDNWILGISELGVTTILH